MKKTISIHIRGIQFIVEDDAYETLQSYLNRLEAKLGSTEGKQEIIEDIELRIAEIFGDIQGGVENKVIVLSDVQKCIALLGEPEDYIDGDTENTENANTSGSENHYSSRSDRKLYRDLERASIAGVCGGLANYFAVDIIVVRIFFLLILFFGGFGLPLYIILWAVLPKAVSHVDRLRMQGKPVTVQSVREEVEMAANRMASESSKFARKMDRESTLQRGVSSIGRLMQLIVGLFFLFFGVTGFILFFTFLVFQIHVLPVTDANGLFSLYEFTGLFYEDLSQLNTIWYVGVIVVAIIVSYLLIAGVKLAFNMDFPWFKYVNRTALTAVIVGTILAFYAGTTLTTKFLFEAEVEKTIDINADELHVSFEENIRTHKKNFSIKFKENNHFWLTTKNGRIYEENNSIRYVLSSDSLYHINIVAQSHGASQDKAFKNASNIQYKISQTGDSLHLARQFSFPLKDKIRGQDIDIIIAIPKNKSVNVNGEKINLEPEEDLFEEEVSKTMYFNGSGKIEIWE